MADVRGQIARCSGTARRGLVPVVALLLAAATALTACGGGGGKSTGSSRTQAQGRAGGTIVWAKPAEVDDTNPTTAIDAGATELLSNVYEGLVGLDANSKPTPKLATSWDETSPTTYVFHIRKGVRFSNGRLMTVADVVGSLKLLTNPKTAANWAPQLGSVERISAKGDSEVEVVLAKPNTAFVAALAHVPASILPMQELRAGTFDPKKQLLGTGPFQVASHDQNEAWQLVRNPHYWGKGLPKVDKLTVRIVKDDAARIAGLRDGSIDVASFDTPDAVKLLEGQRNIKTVLVPSTDFYRLDVNAASSIFKDPRLREAVSLAIDRDQIGKTALAGTSQPTSAVAPGFGTCKPDAVPYGRPDLKRAAQLVAEAGAKGKTVSILASSNYAPFGQIAQVLQSSLQQTGLKVKVEQAEVGTVIERVFSGKAAFDLNVSFFGSLADPAMGLTWWGPEQTWHKAWAPADAQLTGLIEKARSEPAGPARDDTIRAACNRIAENGELIPLVTKPWVVAYRSDKISANFPRLEAYYNPLRDIPEFAVTAG